MRFSSDEIKEQKFKKKMRGLDPEEVDVFVHMVADDFDEFEKENKTLKNKIKDYKLEIESLQRSENKLKASMEEMEKNMPTLEEVEKEGREIILKAKQKAKEIKDTAMNEAVALEKEINKIRALKDRLQKDLANAGEGL